MSQYLGVETRCSSKYSQGSSTRAHQGPRHGPVSPHVSPGLNDRRSISSAPWRVLPDLYRLSVRSYPFFPVPAPCAKLSFAFTVVTQPCWVFADLHESPFPSVVEHSSRGPRDSGSKMARIAYSLLSLVFAATAGLVAGESFRGSYPLAIS